MLLYSRIKDKKTKECEIINQEEAKANGWKQNNVEFSYNGKFYIEGYAPEKPAETLQEKLNRLENEYQMNRWQRESILSENSPYSDFTKARAQELEDIAEQIRKG